VEADSIEAWAALTRKNTLAIVGLGGAGAEAAHDLVDFGIPGVRAFAINTDARHLVRIQVEERILIGERVLRGRGSGGNREAVLDAAEESRDELSRRLSRFEIVFLLAGLGGGTGSALLPYLTTILRKTETLAIPIAFLPFHVELESNSERRTNVLETLQELETMGGLLLLLANEKLRRFDALPLHRVFHVRNAYVHSLVASLVDILENPSQLNVDLSSLKSHLRAAGLSTLLYSVHHISEPERLVHQAFAETLLDFHLTDTPSALVHLDGGSNFTLHTLDRVISEIRHRLGEPRRMLFGTRIRPEPKDVIRMTAVVGGLRSRTARDALGPSTVDATVLPAVL
jgi:cell division protein FtsZ